MNKYQKKLWSLCSDGNVSLKEVDDYYTLHEDKFTAVDSLECCKHVLRAVTAQLMKSAREFEKALSAE